VTPTPSESAGAPRRLLRDTQRQQRARGAATARRVLSVVEELLDAGGESSLRLADVSQRAGVSIGSLYHHFGSREGLICAARADQFLESIPQDTSRIMDLLEGAESAEEFSRNLAEIVVETQGPGRAQTRMRRVELIGAAASRPELLAAISEAQTNVMDVSEVLGQAFKDRGWLREGVEPRELALFVHALALGRVLGDLDEQGVDEEAWTRVVSMALHGILTLDLLAERRVEQHCGSKATPDE